MNDFVVVDNVGTNSNFTFKDDDGNTVWKDPHTYSGGGTQFYVEKAERKNFKEGKVRKI